MGSSLILASLGAAPAIAEPTAGFDAAGVVPAPAHPFQPGRIAVDESTHDVYVIDEGNAAIYRFHADGAFVSQLDGSNTPTRSFELPPGADIAVDNSGGPHQGNIYVLDGPGRRTVLAFDPSGGFLWQKAPDAAPSADWQPCGIAVDRSGSVRVSDAATLSILAFDATGAEASALLLDDEPANPACPIAFDAAGDIYHAGALGGLGELRGGRTALSILPSSAESRVGDLAVMGSHVLANLGDEVQAFNTRGDPVPEWPATTGLIGSVGVATDQATHRVYVGDPEQGAVRTFEWIPPPTVGGQIVFVVQVVIPGQTTAYGSVNPNGNRVFVCYVEWGTTTAFGRTKPCPTLPGAGRVPVSVSIAFTGLPSGVRHYFRFVATNSGGTTVGPTGTMISWGNPGCPSPYLPGPWYGPWCPPYLPRPPTPPQPPAVATGTATQVAEATAIVNGTVDPNGSAITDCHFELGPTAAYGAEVPCVPSPGSGYDPVPVHASVPMTPGVVLHYRLVAQSAAGASHGEDMIVGSIADGEPVPPPGGADPPAPAAATPVPVSAAADAEASSGRLRIAAIDSLGRARLAVHVVCSGGMGAACRGTLAVRAAVRRRGAKRTIVLGTARYALLADDEATVVVHLTRQARRLVARHPRLRLAATSCCANGR